MVLVSNAEIEKLFEWKKGKAGVYAARGVLPEPVQSLACGKLWRLEDIIATAKKNRWPVCESALEEIYGTVTNLTSQDKETLNSEIHSLQQQITELKEFLY